MRPSSARSLPLRSALLLGLALLAAVLALPQPSAAIADPAPAPPPLPLPSTPSPSPSPGVPEIPPKPRDGEVFAGATAEGTAEANTSVGATSDANPLESLGDTGSDAHPYPLDNYGLDEQVQWGTTHLGNTFDRVTQWLIQSVWQIFLYIFSAVLTMLHWAFSLDLLNHQDGHHVSGMAKLTEALRTLHDTVIQPWTLAAIAGLALWGIWNGLLRRKTIDTLRGLALALACMVGLLVVINDPVDTLGTATNIADGASDQVLNAVSRGSVDEPNQAVRSAEQGLFSAVILRPWCALQFGDVDYCLSTPPGIKQSVADTWLQDSPDSKWRTSLWNITGSESEAKARMQGFGMGPPGKDRDLGDMYKLAGHPEKIELLGNTPGSADGVNGGTMPRLALLLLILAGLIGAICLFCFLAARLLLAALFVLILIMFAPAMFLVAALGEAGRMSVIGWAKLLLGAVVEKVIFAFFLAVIVATSNLVIELQLGFLATWLVFIAFWWGVLLKHKELLAPLRLDHKSATSSGVGLHGLGGGNMLSQLFYAKQLAGSARRATRPLTRAATWAPRTALRKAGPRVLVRKTGEHFRREREAARLGESDTIRDVAAEELQETGRRSLERRYATERKAALTTAQPFLEEERRRSRRLSGIDHELATERSRRQVIQTKLGATTRGTPAWGGLQGELESADRRIAHLQSSRGPAREALDSYRAEPEFQRARWVANSEPRQAGEREVQAWVSERRAQLGGRVTSAENLWAAGIDPAEYASAGTGRRAELQRTAQERFDRDRELLDRIDGQAPGRGPAIDRGRRRQARREAKVRPGGRREYDDRAHRNTSQRRKAQRSEKRRGNVR